jgi:hypothetical protein
MVYIEKLSLICTLKIPKGVGCKFRKSLDFLRNVLRYFFNVFSKKVLLQKVFFGEIL